MSFFVLLLFPVLHPHAHGDRLSVGIWAKGDAERAASFWMPTVDYLNRALPGHSFTVHALPPEDLIDGIRRGELDFAVVDPGLWLRLAPQDNATVLATALTRFHKERYARAAGALLVLNERTDIRTPLDLRGKRIVSTARNSLRDWISVEREFSQVGMRPPNDCRDITFVGDAETAVMEVLNGRADAVAVRAGTLEQMQAEGLAAPGQFRALGFEHVGPEAPACAIPVVSSTRTYPDCLFVASRRTSLDTGRIVAAALLSMPGTDDATDRPTLDGWTIPLSDLSIHQCFQDLRLHPYERFGETSFISVVRQYMYWFIAAGVAFIVLIAIDIYVSMLNRALTAEIEERKRAEAALRESVLRFENIATCSSDWIWETNVSGHFTYSSSIVQQMLGYRTEEIVGMHHFELFATAEKERLRAEGQPTLSSGKRVFRERYRMRTKDGRVVIHETTAEPVRNGNGELVGYRGVSRDITDQVRFVRLRV
jgi:PAS domain S-box-containing protein